MDSPAIQGQRSARPLRIKVDGSIHVFRLSGWMSRWRCRALILVIWSALCPLRASTAPEVSPIPRRILILHGWDPKHAEKPSSWPADTMSGELFQTPLEWLGFEVEYLDIGKASLPSPLPERFAAVLLDGDLAIPPAREIEVATWLVNARQRGALLLFTGSFPFSRSDAVRLLAAELGFRGSGELVPDA